MHEFLILNRENDFEGSYRVERYTPAIMAAAPTKVAADSGSWRMIEEAIMATKGLK